MRFHTRPSRLAAMATVSALALATSPAAWAAPPPIPPRIDPPGRVGRLARVAGSVSFHTADADRWSPASVNSPLITGDTLWTEPNARADLQLATNRIAMAPGTELDIATLDEHALATSEPQGEIYLNLRQVPQGDSYTVQTSRGVVQITASGRYGVVAGDADHPTVVTVVDGAAQITGPNLALSVGPRQSATLTGADQVQGSVGPMTQDAFLTTVLAEERPAARTTVAIPPVVTEMTGAEDLDREGRWQETPQYGTIWYPPVEANWVPYRDGRWSYVAPWGWTWVDNASWGFAPFHYGRWVQVDQHWGWIPVTPGAVARPPVYAPALVSFLALGAAGLAAPSVGWVPLGPREPYYPPYRTNLAYVRNLNATNVQNVNQTISTVNVVNNRSVVNNYINRGAATIVPTAAMVGSSPIAAASHALPPEQFAGTRAQFAAPIRPGPATAGVTPAVARQFNFVPPPRPAPGPAIHPGPVVRANAPEAGRQPPAPLAPPPGAAGRPNPAPAAPPAVAVERPNGAPPPAPPAAVERPNGAPAAAVERPNVAPAAPPVAIERPGVAPAAPPVVAVERPTPAPTAPPPVAVERPHPAPPPGAIARPSPAQPTPARPNPVPGPVAARPAPAPQFHVPPPVIRPAPVARPAPPPVAVQASPPIRQPPPARPAPPAVHPAPPPRPAPPAAAPHPAGPPPRPHPQEERRP